MRSTHVRDLPAHERMLRARSLLTQSHPFFASLALHMELRERPAVDTMQVDGKHLDYRPSYVMEQSEPELLGVVAHETLHIALLHHVRRGNRDPEEWNVCCDYSINSRLIAEGFTLPKGGLIDPSFDGMGAEEIYAERQRRREQNQPPPPQPQPQPQDEPEEDEDEGDDPTQDQQGGDDPERDQDQPGDQGGGGDDPGRDQPGDGQGEIAPDPGRCGGVVDAALGEGESLETAEAEAEAMVRQCAAVAAASAGGMPDGIAQILDELNRPRVDWREEFGRFIDSVALSQPTWSRLDRRMQALGYCLPGRTPDAVEEVVCLVDTSASVPRDGSTAFASEVQGMLDSGRVSRVHVVSVDHLVQNVQVFELGDTVEVLDLKGGGGTRSDVGFDWVATNVPDAAAVIYLTDLHIFEEAWGQPPACPLLWTVYGGKRTAPFGEIIPLDPYQ